MNRIELGMVAIGELMAEILAHPEIAISCPRVDKRTSDDMIGQDRIKVDIGFLEHRHIGTIVVKNSPSLVEGQQFDPMMLSVYVHWKLEFISRQFSHEISYVLSLPSDIYNLRDPWRISDAATLIAMMAESRYRRYTSKVR